jgi:ATP-dependent helicase HrpA
MTVTVPLYVLNQVSEERADWLVMGMLGQKVLALLKTLHQKPRARLVPLPDAAERFTQVLSKEEKFGNGFLVDAVLALVRAETSLDLKRADIKPDMLAQHLFMNFRVVDEHGRQLAQGRQLSALKSQWGTQARGAFQALAGLKEVMPRGQESTDVGRFSEFSGNQSQTAQLGHFVKNDPSHVRNASHKQVTAGNTEKTFTTWSFGELPELMEITQGTQTLVGFTALVDTGDAVRIEVFDEPDIAASKHRAGLRRLFAIQIKDAIKYLEKNLPDLQKMSVTFMLVGKANEGSGGGTADELKQQILDLALERAFLLDPLPTDAASFQQRLEEGRGRLTLIANEVARMASNVLIEFAQASRKIKDTKAHPDAVADCAQQLQRLVGKRFVLETPYTQLQHFTRYLKAVVLRLDKLREDPVRDASKMAELKPWEQKYWRLVAERKGVTDERMLAYRWLLEELRVSFFAQELRTPQPVSIKRLEKAWLQMQY